MAPETYVLLSGVLTYGVPLALAVRELRQLRRGDGGGGGWKRETPPPAPPPLPQGGTGRPLPDCLIPKLPPRPVEKRQLELV